MYRKIAPFLRPELGPGLLLALALLIAQPSLVQAVSSTEPGGLPHLQTAAPSGRIVIKLAAGSGLVMDQAGLAVRPGAAAGSDQRALSVKEILASVLPGSRLEKRIPTAPVIPTGQRTGRQYPDLALYAHLNTAGKTREDLVKVVARLNAHQDIALAFLEPVAVPAALGFDAFTGDGPVGFTGKDSPAPATDNWQDLQGYLLDAPLGVGALSMGTVAGQRGAGVTVIDVEGAWLWAHEDLPDPVADLGQHIDELSWRNHGTAVMGEIRGTDNGFGVTGITPDCMVGNSSIGGSNTAAALAAAIEVLSPGDLILIELHAPGPNADGQGQFGYLPMEFWQDNFDVIRLATCRGIIVCEAAGNGYQDLDGQEYLGLFDRQVRDSGAIMCGATAGSDLNAADFSNHGQRVDLNGWGWYVTTSGYGDLQGETEENFYTQAFSGTSSASPIVTASVASLQGMVRQLHGFDLDARLARDILRQTGTEMTSGHLIGTRPNLVEAYSLAAANIGEIQGIVTSQTDGTPLAGVLVQVTGGGSFITTDELGHWRLPLQEGPVVLEFSSFFHHSAQQGVTITAGSSLTLDIPLEPRLLIDITGVVYAEDLTPLAGVIFTVTNQPVDGTVSAADGSFTIGGLPADHIYQLRCDGLPGFGAQVLSVNTEGITVTALANPQLPFVSEDFETGSGDFTSAQGLWALGEPPIEVTGGAFGGSQCWGIGMAGDYADDESDQLLSPIYDLSTVTATDYQLSFHFYSDTEPSFDGVNLEVSDGGPFLVLHPLSGYTDLSLGGLGNQPGWAGDSGRWRGAVFDISAYLGGDFQFRLNWGSDGGITGHGFFIDGIAFGSGRRVTPVQQDLPPSPLATSVKAWPNPFNPLVTLEYALARPGPLQVTVFDVRGRRVRTLLERAVNETRGRLAWDGRNQAGGQAPSGVYFVLVSPANGPPAAVRVVLAK